MSQQGARRPKFVSPSRIARYYYHECERYLRYSSTPREDRAAEGVPPEPYETNPVARALLDGGFVWEETVVQEHLGDRVRIAPPSPDGRLLRDRIHGAEATRQILATLRPGEFIYQPTLVPPATFYARYRIDPAVVTVTESRPDLIECVEGPDGELLLRVIDVKMSPGLKLSHRIQASLYTLILRDVLADAGLADRRIAPDAGVWLVNATEPALFDIRSMLPPLETFLEHELQPLMRRPVADARWHVYFRCEWCPWFEHCADEMRQTNDVSRLPYLSVHAKRFLRELDPPVRTIDDFAALLDDPARTKLLDNSASLRNRPDRLRRQVEALRTGTVQRFGGSSLAMPRAENVRVILTLQTEPVSGQLYAFAFYAQGLKDVLGANPKPAVGVAPAGDADTVAELERDLVRRLYDLLSKVDAYNREREDDWRAKKSLQAYVFDTYEREILTRILVQRLRDPEVAEAALALFFHFQRPELLAAGDHPADEVFFPVVVLTSVLRSVVAMPVEVTYRFADAVHIFQPKDGGFDYKESGYFGFALSNQLRSDAIFAVWHRGQADRVEWIARELRARLWATNSLINGLREFLEGTDTLFAWPPKFRLPDALGFRHPLLSRVAFVARYESVLGYLQVREPRLAPLAERLRSGATVRLRFDEGDRFLVDPDQPELDLEVDGFPNWLLSEESDAGARAMLSYDDYTNRARARVSSRIPVALAAITSVERSATGRLHSVRLALTKPDSFPALRRGQPLLLDARFTDFLTDRAMNELREIDSEPEPAFVRLLADPIGFAGQAPLPAGVRAVALELARREQMTPSQLGAFEALLDRRLQLTWGPPGTGKTHFLGLAILCLAEAHRRAGLSFRALITAFTHAAIDNCLRKTAELQASRQIVRGGIPVGKINRTTLAGMTSVESVSEKDSGDWAQAGPLAVLGGTVWAIRKGFEPGLADLVVIDEGSQLKVPESAIAVRRMSSAGRLLIAGDDRQLPPIVQGAYPDPAEGEPVLHRSIFEALRSRDTEGRITATLLENFRMNDVLCRYPAAQIYVAEYKSATAEIAARRARLNGFRPPSAVLDAILDPEFPLVVGVLEGVRATAENRIEAGLVASVALSLREALLADDGRPYPAGAEGDAAFWERGLFIVSPHHAQIRAIERALRHERAWSARPFVDTVDKMQGQECDVVITSYGVSDVEYAMSEREFIYSLNRLNVATTRARSKSIVFLPRPLLEPPIHAFEDDRIAGGIAFMQGLVRFAERGGSRHRFPLPGSASLVLHRVAATAMGPVSGDR